MEEILEKMVEVICQYRHWSEDKISNLPYRKIENEYYKIVDEKAEKEKEMLNRTPRSLEDTSYTEPEVVSRKDLMAMYPAGISKKDAMGYVYDDFLGPAKPDNGKGRR